MKKFTLTIPLVLTCIIGAAQTPTWSDDVAAIIYENCSSCHREGATAPFPLMSYADAAPISWEIKHQVEDRHMPPWPADPNYRHFAYERFLSDQDIQTIVDWVLADAPSGDLSQAPDPPVFNYNGTQLDVIDFTIEMEPYTLQYNTDEYRWFAIENPYDETIYVNAIEIIPGLPALVHHADLSYDLSGITAANDAQDPLSGFNGQIGGPNYDYYMNAWMAGGNVVQYPEAWGIEVLPNSHFVFEIHYGPGGQGQTDSTKMRLKFVTDTDNVRPIYASWITNGPSEAGAYIPANEVSWYTQQTGIYWSEQSMISICPHQHYLGQSFKVWLETMQGDSIPLIYIPDWHFHWQMYYTFLYPQHIPIGAKIKASASFDNTVYNEHNPNDPPENVYWGSSTTNEMMMVFSIWSPYQEGDEEILMDSTYVPVNLPKEFSLKSAEIYPNPANNHIYLSTQGSDWSNAQVDFYNSSGASLKRLKLNTNLEYFDTSELSEGMYVVRLTKGNRTECIRFVKQ